MSSAIASAVPTSFCAAFVLLAAGPLVGAVVMLAVRDDRPQGPAGRRSVSAGSAS